MIKDTKPDYITVMALLFLMIQCRCSDAAFYPGADNVSESSEAQSSVAREVPAS